jgi:hypothetical protein
MNPNSQYQPQQPGTPPYAGQQQQTPAAPGYTAENPQAFLQANGAVPAGAQAPSPIAMPRPPGYAGGAPQSEAVPTDGAGAIVGGAPAGPGLKPTVNNPNSTQNMLQIAEIRDGIVIMSDGSYRSVVMVNSINFDLMSRSEQEAVEYTYQSFLNSLFFPIQIFIRSQKVDMTPYIEKLDKIRSEHDNMLLSLLMDDYVGYIEALSEQTNIMDKKFYIIIPFFPKIDVQKTFSQSKNFLTGFAGLFGNKEQHVVINEADLAKAKDELRNRVQTVMDGLQQCGIQSLPLDTQELIELYYDTYNPDTATRQQLKNFGDMDVDIVGKGTGVAPQPGLDRELI